MCLWFYGCAQKSRQTLLLYSGVCWIICSLDLLYLHKNPVMIVSIVKLAHECFVVFDYSKLSYCGR